jgi:hypothetical protein
MKYTTQWFVDSAKLVHGLKYDYLDEVSNAHQMVRMRCKVHGIFQQKAYSHLQGYGCKKCGSLATIAAHKLTQEDVLQRFANVHGEKYDYSLVQYSGWMKKVIIGCSEHGKFIQAVGNHMAGQGCPKCCKLNTKEFVKRSHIVHGEKYDYSDTKCSSTTDLVSIRCKQHGVFKQKAVVHLMGSGCQICGRLHRTGYSPGHYTLSLFECHPELKSIPATLYLIEMTNKTEKFLKIGVTTQEVNQRFKCGYGKYKKNILFEKSLSLYQAFIAEQKIKHEFRRHAYTPLLDFGGKTECFCCESSKVMKYCKEIL